MEPSPPLPIHVTLNNSRTGAILHINLQSDGKEERWMEDEQESDPQAKQHWLRKLGCLLKVHGDIECQWPHPPVNTTTTRPLHPDTFNNPWKYTISDFPEGYQLFSVEREIRRKGGPRKDHYLCGVFFFIPSICSLTDGFFSGGKNKYRSPQEFYPHLHWLFDNARGVHNPCICQYCDPQKSQVEINERFPLPPNKPSTSSPKGPSNPKRKGKSQRQRGVTFKRGLTQIRNSITTGPVISPRDSREQKVIGYGTIRPSQF